jgi:hypothetical protein
MQREVIFMHILLIINHIKNYSNYWRSIFDEWDYRRDMDWWIDLLTTYTHHSELHIITALSLISTLHKSIHAKSFSACTIFSSRCLVTALNNGDSTSLLTSLLSCRYPTIELSTELQRNLFSAYFAELNSHLTGSASELLYDWWFTTNQIILATNPLRTRPVIIFSNW